MRRGFPGSLYVLMMVLACAGCTGGGSASLSSIAVTPASPSITVAADEQFTATGTSSDGSTADITSSVTWSSSDTAAATIVETSGLATAVAAGTSTITATSGTISGNTVMTVTAQDLVGVHDHAIVTSSSASAPDLVDVMTANGVSLMILMEPPRADYVADDNSSETLINFFADDSSLFRYMYGGSELNPILFARGYNGTLPITSALVYPNGGTFTPQNITDFNAINTEAEGGAWKTLFRTRARTAAQSSHYVGFGELAPLHLSSKSGQPYITYNADTPWMLWLSDLAAEHNMVMDVHCEATETTLVQLATLLSYNTNTKIIWDHAGWSNMVDTSLATAAVFSQMLADHANLYLSLKMREGQEGANTSPVDSDGTIKNEWYTLLTIYADRIMVGNDAKYWNSSATPAADFDSSYPPLNAMLEQLPSETAVKIRAGTARTLFGLTQ